jgi:hypothetical protein
MMIMLAHPVQHDCRRGHVRNGVAVGWSQDVSSAPARRPPKAAAHCAKGEGSKPAALVRAKKQATPNGNEMPRAKVADLPAGNDAADSNTRAIQQQVTAATAVAEQVTAATAGLGPKGLGPKQQASNIDGTARSKAVQPDDARRTAPASPNNTDPRVALLMARPEIKSVSDLTGKNIALDGRQSAFKASVQTAISEAGATEVKLSGGRTKAINRLTGGEVAAAVLAVVSPEAADGFPEIAGFKIFRIPLAPVQRGHR